MPRTISLNVGVTTPIPFPDPVGQSAGIWQGVFRDEFNTGSLPNPAVWADHLVEGENQRCNYNSTEIEWYPHDKRGLSVAGGSLTLTARHESPYTADPLCPNPLPSGNVGQWTSGMVQSRPGFQMSYGYLESRIRFPTAANGQWPAFWTYSGDVTWPPEIDVAEVFHGTQIFYNYFNNGGTIFGTSDGFSGNNVFHVWGTKWNPAGIWFYMDGVEVHSYTAAAITTYPQHIVYNFAVRDNITPLGSGPWSMDIDYVRAWNPVGVPAQPVISSVTPSNGIPTSGQITVNFAAVSGATSYRATTGPNDSLADGVATTVHRNTSGGSSPLTITGLTNGALYNTTVCAINATGYSIESAPVPAVT